MDVPINPRIMSLCRDNPEVYRELLKRWPQINHTTKTVATPFWDYEVPHQTQTKINSHVADKRGLMAWWWRKLGKLLKRDRWYERGRHIVVDATAQVWTEVVHLESFGWWDPSNPTGQVHLGLGYHGGTDTLLVRR